MVNLRIDTAADQVFIKLGLLGVKRLAFELVYRTGRVPERMRLQFMPSDPTHWVFVKQTFYEVVEILGKVG